MRRPDPEFVDGMKSLEDIYLPADDPMEQSGFSGGRECWVAERLPIVAAIDGDGDFLDVGCANGLLLEDIVAWDHVFSLVDLGPDDLACEWLMRLAAWVAPEGRLIIGSYGSRSRGFESVNVARLIEECGYHVTGEALAGERPISRFAWTDPC